MKNSIYRWGARDLALAMNLVWDLTPALDLEKGERLEILTRPVVDPPVTPVAAAATEPRNPSSYETPWLVHKKWDCNSATAAAVVSSSASALAAALLLAGALRFICGLYGAAGPRGMPQRAASATRSNLRR